MKEFIARLKAMGLGDWERQQCCATYRDSGEAEALEQAERYVAQSKAQIESARQAAKQLCGLDI